MKQKACKYCGGENHPSWKCFDKPRIPLKNNQLKHRAGVDPKWIETRHEWIHKHPPIDGGYSCHYCRKFITLDQLTLDHKIPKSGLGITYKYQLDNLVPSCYPCNIKKGSIHYDNYIKDNCPHLL